MSGVMAGRFGLAGLLFYAPLVNILVPEFSMVMAHLPSPALRPAGSFTPYPGSSLKQRVEMPASRVAV